MGGWGSSDADVLTFSCKNFGFFKIYGVSALYMDKGREVEPVRTFCGQGGGVNFLRFRADVFYGRSLRKKFKQKRSIKSNLGLLPNRKTFQSFSLGTVHKGRPHKIAKNLPPLPLVR